MDARTHSESRTQAGADCKLQVLSIKLRNNQYGIIYVLGAVLQGVVLVEMTEWGQSAQRTKSSDC